MDTYSLSPASTEIFLTEIPLLSGTSVLLTIKATLAFPTALPRFSMVAFNSTISPNISEVCFGVIFVTVKSHAFTYIGMLILLFDSFSSCISLSGSISAVMLRSPIEE